MGAHFASCVVVDVKFPVVVGPQRPDDVIVAVATSYAVAPLLVLVTVS